MLSFWPVDGSLHGLSVTSSLNLLAAFSNPSVLQEYSTGGRLLRKINLKRAGITVPLHSVQLTKDQFAVIHRVQRGQSCKRHQFSTVRADGQLVKSYRGEQMDMNTPQGIAVDQRGKIFVADQNNNRILVIDSKTLSAFPLPLSADCKLDGPYSIHFDPASSRLYIGEWNAGRIICCKL